jgi:hypothetical protein
MEVLGDARRETRRRRNGLRRLAGAFQGTGVDRRQALALQARGEARGLRPAGFPEAHARHAAAEHMGEPVVGGVADEEHRRGRHDILRVRAGSSPAMKLRVRSRASLSVYCSGGDFMK